jgi:hypothetical protein
VKLACVSLLVVGLVAAGCGDDESATTTGTAPKSVEIRTSPDFKSVQRACGAATAQTLARDLGLSSTDPAAIAREYAQRNAPLALRQDVYEGCLSALTK